jgi:hypothetical protein
MWSLNSWRRRRGRDTLTVLSEGGAGSTASRSDRPGQCRGGVRSARGVRRGHREVVVDLVKLFTSAAEKVAALIERFLESSEAMSAMLEKLLLGVARFAADFAKTGLESLTTNFVADTGSAMLNQAVTGQQVDVGADVKGGFRAAAGTTLFTAGGAATAERAGLTGLAGDVLKGEGLLGTSLNGAAGNVAGGLTADLLSGRDGTTIGEDIATNTVTGALGNAQDHGVNHALGTARKPGRQEPERTGAVGRRRIQEHGGNHVQHGRVRRRLRSRVGLPAAGKGRPRRQGRP